jgi:Rap1a immunity proteins
MNVPMKVMLAMLTVPFMPVAQAMDGHDLLAGYNSYQRVKAGIAAGTDAYQGGLFDGYVSGVLHTSAGLVLCAPPDVKGGQIQEVVGQFLEAHPATLQRPAVLLTTQALMKSFPCK